MSKKYLVSLIFSLILFVGAPVRVHAQQFPNFGNFTGSFQGMNFFGQNSSQMPNAGNFGSFGNFSGMGSTSSNQQMPDLTEVCGQVEDALDQAETGFGQLKAQDIDKMLDMLKQNDMAGDVDMEQLKALAQEAPELLQAVKGAIDCSDPLGSLMKVQQIVEDSEALSSDSNDDWSTFPSEEQWDEWFKWAEVMDTDSETDSNFSQFGEFGSSGSMNSMPFGSFGGNSFNFSSNKAMTGSFSGFRSFLSR